MRYIYRRQKADDLVEIRAAVPNVETQLGKPGENFRHFIQLSVTELRYAQFTFLTRKSGADWRWVCPSVELVAEDEKGLFALADQFKIPRPAHLKHLSA